MAALVGIEPTFLITCSTTELQGNEVPQIGIEPTTFRLSSGRSSQLSYWGKKEERWANYAVDWFNSTRRISHPTISPI
jgi:hypothetical protein